MWRIVPGAVLMLGFPAWFVWWIDSPSVLIYLYAVGLYATATVFTLMYGIVSYIDKQK